MLPPAPDCNFHHSTHPIQEEKHPDSENAFTIEHRRQGVDVENCHEVESTQDAE